jgi:hypothetical protein
MKHDDETMTASDFLTQLHSDPEWVRQHEERLARHAAKTAQLQAELEPEEGPLLAELARIGHVVGSVWDLVNTKSSYPAAIPVLTRFLPRSTHPVLRSGIARALTVPEAQGLAGREILDELKRGKDAPGSESRWALANALPVAADKSMVDEIKAMIDDSCYDDVRERLTITLENLRGE